MMMVTSQLVDLEHTLQFHKPILRAIERRDPALAQKLMTDHLTDAGNLLRTSREQAQQVQMRRHFGKQPEAVRLR